MTHSVGGCGKTDDLFAGRHSASPPSPRPIRRSFGISPAIRPNGLSRAAFPSSPTDSLHPPVKSCTSNPRSTFVSGWRFPSRKKRVSRKDVPQWAINCFTDANAWSSLDFSCVKAVVSNPQSRTRRSQIDSVITHARDAKSFGHTAGAAGESNEIARTLQRDSSRLRHLFDAIKRFERSEKNSPGLPVSLARNV